MIKNAKSLKDKARNVANENAISIQQVLQNYMFEIGRASCRERV